MHEINLSRKCRKFLPNPGGPACMSRSHPLAWVSFTNLGGRLLPSPLGDQYWSPRCSLYHLFWRWGGLLHYVLMEVLNRLGRSSSGGEGRTGGCRWSPSETSTAVPGSPSCSSSPWWLAATSKSSGPGGPSSCSLWLSWTCSYASANGQKHFPFAGITSFAFTILTSLEIGLFTRPLLYLTMACDFFSESRNPIMQPKAGWMPLVLLLARSVIKTTSFTSRAERIVILPTDFSPL